MQLAAVGEFREVVAVLRPLSFDFKGGGGKDGGGKGGGGGDAGGGGKVGGGDACRGRDDGDGSET